jgi:hypothetical protein
VVIADSKPKRRWFRFSLRTLLLLMAIACVGFSWFGYKLRQAERQRAAVESLEKLGISVTYDYQMGSNRFGALQPTPPGPEWLRKSLGIDFVADVTDLRLFHNALTDSEAEHLQGLTRLKALDLSATQITDAALVHLEGLTQLTKLNLAGTKITSAGLMHLQGLTKLEVLFLTNTQITDSGLEHFRGLKKLKTLYMSRTPQVTDVGCAELQKSLPKLEIVR